MNVRRFIWMFVPLTSYAFNFKHIQIRFIRVTKSPPFPQISRLEMTLKAHNDVASSLENRLNKGDLIILRIFILTMQ